MTETTRMRVLWVILLIAYLLSWIPLPYIIGWWIAVYVPAVGCALFYFVLKTGGNKVQESEN